MLITRLKNNLGKSSHGGETLYDHMMDSVKIAHKVLTNQHFVPAGYSKQKCDQLLFSTFIHDIGKLDPTFQTMLQASRDGQSMPSKHVKHEASSLDFEQLIMEAQDEVKSHLHDELDYKFTESIDLDIALAFAVTHHGLFYESFEKRNREIIRRVRREWTLFNYGEQLRITLADLLFDYHPLGGLVMISDLLGSFCYEKGIANPDIIIGQARSMRQLIDILLHEGAPETVEDSVKRYDPCATYGLRDLLTLLAGGSV